ncbi:hypothetical protein A2U01_0063264, partial [Trifolium medium]|nr:hypothetical protein [Trifolium medium]
MATAESLVESTMKRQRDGEENNGVSGDKDPNGNGVSSVIPG